MLVFQEDRTPLHTASRYGQTAVVKALLESKADTNVVDKVIFLFSEVLQLLLLSLKNGDAAVGIALRNKHLDVVKCLEDHVRFLDVYIVITSDLYNK